MTGECGYVEVLIKRLDPGLPLARRGMAS